eukprot:6448178-Lingulodinium_polyedra.AAC.1
MRCLCQAGPIQPPLTSRARCEGFLSKYMSIPRFIVVGDGQGARRLIAGDRPARNCWAARPM